MKITVEVEDIENKLILRELVADGDCEGYDFIYCVSVGSPIVEVNGRKFKIAVSDIVQAVVVEMIKEQRHG